MKSCSAEYSLYIVRLVAAYCSSVNHTRKVSALPSSRGRECQRDVHLLMVWGQNPPARRLGTLQISTKYHRIRWHIYWRVTGDLFLIYSESYKKARFLSPHGLSYLWDIIGLAQHSYGPDHSPIISQWATQEKWKQWCRLPVTQNHEIKKSLIFWKWVMTKFLVH